MEVAVGVCHVSTWDSKTGAIDREPCDPLSGQSGGLLGPCTGGGGLPVPYSQATYLGYICFSHCRALAEEGSSYLASPSPIAAVEVVWPFCLHGRDAAPFGGLLVMSSPGRTPPGMSPTNCCVQQMIHAPFTRSDIPTAYLHYIQSWGCNEWGWLRLGGSPALSQMGARWRLAPSGLETGQITPTLRLRLGPRHCKAPLAVVGNFSALR